VSDRNNYVYRPGFHDAQGRLFLGGGARFKIISKGRRFGFTRGLALFVLLKMLSQPGISVLWVDTIYSNIERYFDRYFRPELKKLNKRIWNYNRNKSEFTIRFSAKSIPSVLDLRSADRPENLEGFGYHLIIINEAGIVLKNRNLWQESILPMTLDYKAEVIIGGTPKGKKTKSNEKHLFFELFERGLTDDSGRYKSYNFSSYDNPLLDKNEIDELVKETPAHLRDQEIFGRFVDVSQGRIIKREWFKFFELHELARKKRLSKIQIWDTAGKTKQENDFSVCETWVETVDGYYLTNVYRERLEFPELKKKAIELYESELPDQVWIEDKSSGTALIQELRRNTRIPLKEIKAEKDKLEYVNACSPLIEGGRVFLPFSAEWLDSFIGECEDFPGGEFDDQVDVMSKYLNEKKTKSSDVEEYKIKILSKREIRSRKYAGYRK
jgi:predicted phage terminase large subunit-like protein